MDWNQKVKDIKAKLEELNNIRRDHVKKDIERLRNKIDEHEQVHLMSVQDLSEQNRELEKLIRSLQLAKDETQKLLDRNQRIRDEIAKKDPVLGVIAEYPLLKVSKTTSGRQIVYYISAGTYCSFVIVKNIDQELIYNFQSGAEFIQNSKYSQPVRVTSNFPTFMQHLVGFIRKNQ